MSVCEFAFIDTRMCMAETTMKIRILIEFEQSSPFFLHLIFSTVDRKVGIRVGYPRE